MKKWITGFLVLLALLSLFAELSQSFDAEHGHWWNKIPGFFIFFGLFGCFLLILLAKALGRYLLTRDENYYDDK
ncbi:hypothetical protein ACFLRX_02250 [Acidobacteriota bacterium]